jgi:hypothetical protein
VQVGAADLADARQRLGLDLAELAEVHRRRGRQLEGQAGGGCRRCAGAQRLLDEGLDVVLEHAALATAALDPGEVDAELAGEAAHGRAGVRGAAGGDGLHVLGARQHRRLAPLGLPGQARRRGRRIRLGIAAGAWALSVSSAELPGVVVRRHGSAVPSSVSSRSPWLSVSPTLTAMDCTTPAAGEGISMVALSLSSVRMD